MRSAQEIGIGDDFSHQSTQAKDNYDSFDQTIMGLEVRSISISNRRPFKSSSPARKPLRGGGGAVMVMENGGDLLSMLYSLKTCN